MLCLRFFKHLFDSLSAALLCGTSSYCIPAPKQEIGKKEVVHIYDEYKYMKIDLLKLRWWSFCYKAFD